MNILIFGASGATGHELVKQSLAKGHAVTAFVRNPEKLAIKHQSLKSVQGDVKDYPSVEAAVKGQDAVLSALGVSRPLKSDPVVIDGVRNIVKAMEQNNVRRLIYLSFIGVTESRKDAGFMLKHIISRIVRNEIADHEEKEKLVRASALEWTIVRPPKLTNGNAVGVYRSGEEIKAHSLLPTMSRADVADFMLRQLTEKAFIHKSPRIMY
ncbi:MAG: SDR family oxidoreductase [Ignavibacteriae bacterium]|nr:SDR family oxidoreductase [Ignavibacteria bacterium]MBI3365782.1 SDR family oxidoreductase [Ignavibacteriota bacterium]